ncbi:MAG: DUF2252 family protein [Pseudanabaena sp. ELA607]
MAKTNIYERIDNFNRTAPRQPIPELLKMKYDLMRHTKDNTCHTKDNTENNPFVFFRGTCHLFYEDLDKYLTEKSWFAKAPLAWICGDLHIENFGNFKADNRHVYFDINDFDEAVIAPLTWEIARVLTSIFVASATFKVVPENATKLAEQLLDAYVTTLAQGKTLWMGEDTAPEVIADLLCRKKNVKRQDILDNRTHFKDGATKRSIKIDQIGDQIDAKKPKALKISAPQKQKIADFMESFAAQQANPQFFKLLDVAQRVAGTGSLGVERYVVLIEGNGSPDGNYLLDLKRALPSALAPYLAGVHKNGHSFWHNEAERIVQIQQRAQAIPIAFLQAVTIGTDSFILRELQSTKSPTDCLKIKKWDDDLAEAMALMKALGQVVAWSHLRSSGRQGAAIADELIDFAAKSKWKIEVMEYAQKYAQQVDQDWREFCQESKSR